MVRFVKLLAVVGLVAFGLSFVGESQASIVQIPDAGNGYLGYGTVSQWDGSPVTQLDKVWTYLWSTPNLLTSTGSPQTVYNSYDALFTYQTPDVHELQVGDFLGRIFYPGTYELKYSVAVNGAGPGTSFQSATAGIYVSGAGYSFSENIYQDPLETLLITAPVPNGPIDNLVNGYTILYVNDTLTVTTAIYADGFTNTFTENTVVPEPTTLAVWSLLAAGGLGMRVLRRRGGSARRQAWSKENRTAILETIQSHCSKS